MDDDLLEDTSPRLLRITHARVAFPVLTANGFGQIVVAIEPGQQETIEINGRLITVIRDHVH